ncbi:MAG: 2-hydroxychromene-2-carboxylate isomerase [Gammaproteobacteria bacterium]|nr:MAG: 2-hydroxychromene-2-carboxylate isomerase [Gammaproteobacteria bacterium]
MSQPASVDYVFDFSSPFAYIGSRRIEAVAARHGRRVHWQPILLGAVFKVTGGAPLIDTPLKGPYTKHDLMRAAREHGTPFIWPDIFPISSVAASRATIWLRDNDDDALRARTADFIHAVFAACYAENRDISSPEVLATVANALGLDADLMMAGMSDRVVKDRLRSDVAAAIEKGVFGTPTIFVDGEMFWGSDRIDQVDRWLERGGW